MTLIWRGMGILVPITFVICGLLTAWITGDPDPRLGNAHLMGWTALWTSIVLILIGVVLIGSRDKDANGQPIKTKHDFFYIPVIVWGVLFGGLCIYLLGFAGKPKEADPSPFPALNLDDFKSDDSTPITRFVNFYNPTADSAEYIVMDKNLSEPFVTSDKLGPYAVAQVELPEGSYLFFGYDEAENSTLTYLDEKYVSDKEKYEPMHDDDGDYYQRKLGAATPENDDYDEAWVVLDGKTDFLLVNVTSACDRSAPDENIKKAKWVESIQEEYDSNDLIEPLYKQYLKDKVVKVVSPGATLPTEVAENETWYLLVPYTGQKDKNAVIVKAILAARG